MLSSTCLYIAYSFCSALHRGQVWKAVFRRYCDSGLRWCWSTLAENNERLPLTSSRFGLGLQGRELRCGDLPHTSWCSTQIALAGSSVMEIRICTCECHLMQTCFAACKYTEGNKYAREQQNWAQLPRWSAEGEKSWCSVQEGLKFRGSLAQRQDSGGQLLGFTVPLWKATFPRSCWSV